MTKNFFNDGRDFCGRCGGKGYLAEYGHIAGGVCFACNGTRFASGSSFPKLPSSFDGLRLRGIDVAGIKRDGDMAELFVHSNIWKFQGTVTVILDNETRMVAIVDDVTLESPQGLKLDVHLAHALVESLYGDAYPVEQVRAELAREPKHVSIQLN